MTEVHTPPGIPPGTAAAQRPAIKRHDTHAMDRASTQIVHKIARMQKIEEELKQQLARELCAMFDGWPQVGAAAMCNTHQSEFSRLRRGDLRRFSVGRLLRMIVSRHYDVEVHLRQMPRPYAKPRVYPTVTVTRYNRYGQPELHVPGKVE